MRARARDRAGAGVALHGGFVSHPAQGANRGVPERGRGARAARRLGRAIAGEAVVRLVALKPGAQLALRGVLSRTGWQLPEEMTEEEWEDAGRQLGRVETALLWWIGDWWAFGEHRY